MRVSAVYYMQSREISEKETAANTAVAKSLDD